MQIRLASSFFSTVLRSSAPIHVLPRKYSTAAQLIEACDSNFKAIIHSPFVQRVREGTLDENTLHAFAVRDILFQNAYINAMQLRARKFPPNHPLRALFYHYAESTIETKVFLLKNFLVTGQEADVTPFESDQAYISHILTTAAQGSLGEFAAASLPCIKSFYLISQSINESVDSQTHPQPALLDFFKTGYRKVAQLCAMIDDEVTQAPENAIKIDIAFTKATEFAKMFILNSIADQHNTSLRTRRQP